MFNTIEDIAQDIIAVGFDHATADPIAAQSRPAVWLETRTVADEADIAPGATKLGGCPDLPQGVEWPIRAAYPNAAKTAQSYRDEAANPVKHWSWATPEDREIFARESLERAQRIETAQPLSFVAQINFAEMWAAGSLDPDFPRQGVLSLFYDLEEMPWGFDPQERVGFAVLFYEGSALLTRRKQPATLPKNYHLPPMACTAHASMTPLPLPMAQYDALDLPETVSQELWNTWWCSEDEHLIGSCDGKDWCCHRIGGWPTPIQGDMQTECALVHNGHYCGSGETYKDSALAAIRATATDWLLLAQIGTDDKGGMAWGDSGQIYLWIRRDDLIAQRFDQVHLILQCY